MLTALRTAVPGGPAARSRHLVVGGKPFLPAAAEVDRTLATAFGVSGIPIHRRIARRHGRAV